MKVLPVSESLSSIIEESVNGMDLPSFDHSLDMENDYDGGWNPSDSGTFIPLVLNHSKRLQYDN